MKFTVNKTDFEKAITPVSIIAQNKTKDSDLNGIYIEAKDDVVTLYCYDLEKGIKTSLESFVASSGSIIADSNIVQIVHSMPDGDITFTSDDNYAITLSCGDSVFQILGKDAMTYPAIPEIKGHTAFSISKKQIKNLITKTVFSLSKDDTNPILNGSFFEIKNNTLTVSAIDGYRCAVRSEKSSVDNPDLNISFIIPGRAQMNLLKIMEDNDEEIQLELGNKHLIMYMDNLYFSVRLIEGDFPKYEKFIPEYTTTAVVSRDSFIDCLERVAIINSNLKSSARLVFSNDTLKVSCETESGKVSDTIPVHMDGDEKDILFNQNFILEALRCCENDNVLIRLSDSGRGTVITSTKEDTSEDSSYLYLIMPKRGR